VFWFWFWVVNDLLTLALDVVWWVVVMRLTKRRFWRVVLSVFLAAQMGALFSAMCGLQWYLYTPKFVLVSVLVWHGFVLRFTVAACFFFGIVAAGAWSLRRMARLTGAWLCRPKTTTAKANVQTRREFIGACAAIVPPLFTVSGTAVALAQLNRFRVRRFTLSIPALPPALDGITIAHVSDMHVGRLTCGRVLREMVNITNALRPDLVLLTGDLIHYHLADLSEAIALVKRMAGRYGLWMIEGNHDLFDDGPEFERRVKAAGVPLLLDETAIANVRGYPVQFFGLRWLASDKGRGPQGDWVTALQMRALMKHRQADAFPILLAHHPHAFDAAVAAGLPLTLAGHTHGGQWMLDSQRGVGPVLFRYWSGLYTRGRSQLIVSNGVGNVFPVRINAPAEIVHITLRKAGSHA
jgi:predicted MPP superfamily phosphohydrolase